MSMGPTFGDLEPCRSAQLQLFASTGVLLLFCVRSCEPPCKEEDSIWHSLGSSVVPSLCMSYSAGRSEYSTQKGATFQQRGPWKAIAWQRRDRQPRGFRRGLLPGQGMLRWSCIEAGPHLALCKSLEERMPTLY